jgi:hypothetical protein
MDETIGQVWCESLFEDENFARSDVHGTWDCYGKPLSAHFQSSPFNSSEVLTSTNAAQQRIEAPSILVPKGFVHYSSYTAHL